MAVWNRKGRRKSEADDKKLLSRKKEQIRKINSQDSPLSDNQKQIIISQIQDILQGPDWTMGKVLRIQERIQRIVPKSKKKPDHILVILRELGEHLELIEPFYKDWAKEGDKIGVDEIDWTKAAEELADVFILAARAIISFKEYTIQREFSYMMSDLMDAPMQIQEGVEMGQLMGQAIAVFISPNTPFEQRASSLYHIVQYASMLPFGARGLKEAWEKKVIKVVHRKYNRR